MTPETRERLVRCWERIPETQNGMVWSAARNSFCSDDSTKWGELSDDLAEHAACGKLFEWLTKSGLYVEAEQDSDGFFNVRVREDDWVDGRTLLDVLLAAVEATTTPQKE